MFVIQHKTAKLIAVSFQAVGIALIMGNGKLYMDFNEAEINAITIIFQCVFHICKFR